MFNQIGLSTLVMLLFNVATSFDTLKYCCVRGLIIVIYAY